jgi:glutathione-regulated potassium-efflux system protein KefB
MTAVVTLSMAATPLVALGVERLRRRSTRPLADDVERADGLRGRLLVIGFGRFAQVVSQPLLARGCEVSLIEIDVDMIRAAASFGFKVYYGDGTRLDVLRASGASEAQAILVCVDDAAAADRIVELCQAEFPGAKLFVRAYDRGHAMRLVRAGVDYQVRETFESALAFGRAVLAGLGTDPVRLEEIMEDVRRRDDERLDLQVAGGLQAGRTLIRGNVATPVPEPLVAPRHEGRIIAVDTASRPDDAAAGAR